MPKGRVFDPDAELTNDELRARLSWALGERELAPFVEPLRELQRRRAEVGAPATPPGWIEAPETSQRYKRACRMISRCTLDVSNRALASGWAGWSMDDRQELADAGQIGQATDVAVDPWRDRTLDQKSTAPAIAPQDLFTFRAAESPLTWEEIKRMKFEPIALQAESGVYRWRGPDGQIVTLDTGRTLDQKPSSLSGTRTAEIIAAEARRVLYEADLEADLGPTAELIANRAAKQLTAAGTSAELAFQAATDAVAKAEIARRDSLAVDDPVKAQPSAEALRGLQLMRGHLDGGGHDWSSGTAMADVQAARDWLDAAPAPPLDEHEKAFFARKLDRPCMAHDRQTLRACIVPLDDHDGIDHAFGGTPEATAYLLRAQIDQDLAALGVKPMLMSAEDMANFVRTVRSAFESQSLAGLEMNYDALANAGPRVLAHIAALVALPPGRR